MVCTATTLLTVVSTKGRAVCRAAVVRRRPAALKDGGGGQRCGQRKGDEKEIDSHLI